MSFTEVVVVIGGLLIGYWAVSLFARKETVAHQRPEPKKAEPEQPRSGQSSPPPRDPQPEPPHRNPSPKLWHEILEIRQSASATEIRSAYKSLMSKYHPDKVATLGAELKEVAERKSKEIGEAYRQGMRARGVEP